MDSIEAGMSITDACELAGIGRGTFYHWKERHPKALRKLRETELKAKRRNLLLVNKFATADWRAAAWYLERKYPQEFALRGRTQDATNETLEKLDNVLKEMKVAAEK